MRKVVIGLVVVFLLATCNLAEARSRKDDNKSSEQSGQTTTRSRSENRPTQREQPSRDSGSSSSSSRRSDPSPPPRYEAPKRSEAPSETAPPPRYEAPRRDDSSSSKTNEQQTRRDTTRSDSSSSSSDSRRNNGYKRDDSPSSSNGYSRSRTDSTGSDSSRQNKPSDNASPSQSQSDSTGYYSHGSDSGRSSSSSHSDSASSGRKDPSPPSTTSSRGKESSGPRSWGGLVPPSMRGRKTQTEENAPKPDTGHQESADRNASARNDQPKVEEHRGPVADKPNMGANDHRTPAPDFKPTNRPDEVRGNDHQGSSAGRTSIGPKGNSRGPSVGPGGKAPSVDHRPFGPPSVAKRSDKNGRQYEVRNDRPQIEHHFSSADAKRNIMRSNYGSAHRDRIPAGAKVFDRNKVVRSHYDHVVGRMGFAPHHKYYYTPYHYRAPVVNECYYGWYVPVVPVGVVCYWSPYYRYGLPAYIDSTRVVVVDNYIYQPAVEETLDIEGISLAKAHIRDAFCLADISLLDGLLSSEGVRACFDGEYKYTIPSDDFYAMSSDMVASTETISLVFDPAVWISSREVYTSGVHTFRDADGKVQTLYVSYRLRKLDGDWQIVEYGSSESPLPCPYNDFRNP